MNGSSGPNLLPVPAFARGLAVSALRGEEAAAACLAVARTCGTAGRGAQSTRFTLSTVTFGPNWA